MALLLDVIVQPCAKTFSHNQDPQLPSFEATSTARAGYRLAARER